MLLAALIRRKASIELTIPAAQRNVNDSRIIFYTAQLRSRLQLQLRCMILYRGIHTTTFSLIFFVAMSAIGIGIGLCKNNLLYLLVEGTIHKLAPTCGVLSRS